MHCYRWRVCGWNTWRVSDRYEWTVSSEYARVVGFNFQPAPAAFELEFGGGLDIEGEHVVVHMPAD